jgi:hypothetical protein
MGENDKHYCTCFTSNLSAEDRITVSRSKAAVLQNARWQTGAKITIRFLEGDRGLQRKVREVAMEWKKPPERLGVRFSARSSAAGYIRPNSRGASEAASVAEFFSAWERKDLCGFSRGRRGRCWPRAMIVLVVGGVRFLWG